MKPFTAATAAGAIALALALPAQAGDPDRVVARVGDTEITLGHVIGLMARLPAEYHQLPDETLFEGIVEQLIDQTAVAEARGEPFSRRLQVDLDNSRREVVVNDTLAAVIDAAVSEEALQALYAERYLDAEPEREFNAAHILVETEEEAEALQQELRDGADFGDLAREHSGDPGSAQNDGALGWFGAGQMVGPFEAAVLALEAGEISDPVETQFGWHLILLNESRLSEAPGFDQVRGGLAQELQQQAVLDHIAAARAAVEVEVMADGIDPATIRDQTLLDD